MKNKKIILIFSILLILIIVSGLVIINYFKKNRETLIEEYTPQEEISNEQARQTIVTLYFANKETGELTPEARLVNIKEIINTPVEKLIGLLIEGPKKSQLERILPENTVLEKSYIEGNTVILEFSNEFSNENTSDEKYKNNIINSIKNTLTQLTEIDEIKILINGTQFI